MGYAREIVDIVLHPDEPPIGDKPAIHLKYMSAYILVKNLANKGDPVRRVRRQHYTDQACDNILSNQNSTTRWKTAYQKLFVDANTL